MNRLPSTPIVGSAQLKKLRNALAIIHCRRLVSTFQKEAEGTISHDQAKRVTYLTELFSRIHREIFQDWKEQAITVDRPGAMAEAEKRKRFREVIESLVLNEDENKDTALFDNNGFVIKTDNIASVAAAGADTFVAGSAIFGQADYAKTIGAMRAALAGG